MIHHAQHRQDSHDRRELEVFLAIFKTRKRGRTDASEQRHLPLRQTLGFAPLPRLFDNSCPVNLKLPFHRFSTLSIN